MNQRFNAHDLWTRVCQEEMPELDESCMTMQRTRKFAELLIRECIEQGKQIQSQSVSNGSEEYNTGREMGIEVFLNQIKKHFGVE